MNINFLWSKGLYNRNNYMLKQTESVSNNNEIINEIKTCDTYIWIRNGSHKLNRQTDLDIFAKNINYLNKNIILITGDGDRPTPSSYKSSTVNTILNCKYINKWMTQNYDKSIIHDKLTFYPIGLDLHTPHWLINNSVFEKINFIKNMRSSDIIYNVDKIFCDSHLRITNNERINMYQILKNNKNIDFLDKSLDYKNITEKYRSYKFVLSPRGNGVDCHRTWELFLLGCIVITKTSSLDKMYIDNKLPVVILNDWNELNVPNLNEKLIEWFNKYNELTVESNIYHKFNHEYWL